MDGITITCVQEKRLPNWYGKQSSSRGASKTYSYETQKRHRRLGQNYVHALQRRILQQTEHAAFIRVAALPVQIQEDALQFEARFKALVRRWREETKTVSSTTDRALHTAYQDIIGMGDRALPLIFREMQERGGHWFWALRHITHDNPVPPENAGQIQKMTEAWLRWGREHRYL